MYFIQWNVNSTTQDKYEENVAPSGDFKNINANIFLYVFVYIKSIFQS